MAALVERPRSTFLSGGGRHAVLVDRRAGMPLVMADRRRIVQVLNNLFSTPRGTPPSRVRSGWRLRARTRTSPSRSPTRGAGVAPERLPHLFSKHAGAGQARRRATASGSPSRSGSLRRTAAASGPRPRGGDGRLGSDHSRDPDGWAEPQVAASQGRESGAGAPREDQLMACTLNSHDVRLARPEKVTLKTTSLVNEVLPNVPVPAASRGRPGKGCRLSGRPTTGPTR